MFAAGPHAVSRNQRQSYSLPYVELGVQSDLVASAIMTCVLLFNGIRYHNQKMMGRSINIQLVDPNHSDKINSLMSSLKCVQQDC